MKPQLIPTSDLQLADKVQLTLPGERAAAYMTATVEEITDEYVICIRPYIHTADFSTTHGVITYIGFEKVSLVLCDSRQVVLLERSELK